MNFGTAVGDVLAIGKLCRQVYMAINDGPRDLQEARAQLSSLEVALNALTEAIGDPGDGGSGNAVDASFSRIKEDEKASLVVVLKGCDNTLREFQILVNRYATVTTPSKLSRLNLKFGLKDGPALAGIRTNIMLHTNSINLLLQSFQSSTLNRIELNRTKWENVIMAKLGQILGAVQSGARDPDVLLPLKKHGRDELDMTKLFSTLENEGIPGEIVAKNERSIKGFTERHRDTVSRIESGQRDESSLSWESSTQGVLEPIYQNISEAESTTGRSEAWTELQSTQESAVPWKGPYLPRDEGPPFSQHHFPPALKHTKDTAPQLVFASQAFCPICARPIEFRNLPDHMKSHSSADRISSVEIPPRASGKDTLTVTSSQSTPPGEAPDEVPDEVEVSQPEVSQPEVSQPEVSQPPDDRHASCPACLKPTLFRDMSLHLETHTNEVDHLSLASFKHLFRMQQTEGPRIDTSRQITNPNTEPSELVSITVAGGRKLPIHQAGYAAPPEEALGRESLIRRGRVSAAIYRAEFAALSEEALRRGSQSSSRSSSRSPTLSISGDAGYQRLYSDSEPDSERDWDYEN